MTHKIVKLQTVNQNVGQVQRTRPGKNMMNSVMIQR